VTLQTVLRMGEESLLQPSVEVVDIHDTTLSILIENMLDTMHEKGGVGIAAPQIGVNKRVIVFGFEHSARYPNEEPVPMTILINPQIEIIDATLLDGWEGCLSVPGIRGLVPRCKKIKYTGLDADGKKIARIAENFHARVVQHEMDHIDGILYPQKIADMKNFGFEDVLWKKITN